MSASQTLPNKFTRGLAQLDSLPQWLARPLRNRLLGRVVPLVGTARLDFVEINPNRLEIRLANHRRVRNHIGQIHAGAMILLAETATGFIVGRNLPDDRLPLIKTITTHFRRRTQGAMTAVATLTDAQIALIQQEPKGETLVPVTVTDESGQPPIECEMLWAWVPKQR